MQAIPNLADVRTYKVRQSGNVEAIGWSLYDFGTPVGSPNYAQAGQTSLSFFQSPVGQNSKTLDDTNMQLAGQLPSGQAFLIESIEIVLLPLYNVWQDVAAAVVPAMANDVYKFARSGNLTLTIGNKQYVQDAPLGKFPPKTRVANAAAVATTDTTETVYCDYAQMSGRPYVLRSPFLLESSQSFALTLNWASAVALSAAARVGVVLEGVLYRDVQ